MHKVAVYLALGTLAFAHSATAQIDKYNVILQDAKALATRKNISEDEAIMRLAIEDKLSNFEIADSVDSEIVSTKTKFFVRFYVTQNNIGKTIMSTLLADTALLSYIQIDTAPVSLEDLEKARTYAIDKFSDAKLEIGTSINGKLGKVLIEVRDVSIAKTLLKDSQFNKIFILEK